MSTIHFKARISEADDGDYYVSPGRNVYRKVTESRISRWSYVDVHEAKAVLLEADAMRRNDPLDNASYGGF